MSTEVKKAVDVHELTQLLQNWVIIRGATPAEKTAGGLYIPDSAKAKPDQGIILASGPGEGPGTGAPNEGKMTVAVGDSVLFSRMRGIDIEIEGEKLILMREGDIFLILKKKECKTAVLD